MKNYKIVRIADIHCLPAKESFYKSNPGIHLQTYDYQQKMLFQHGYMYSNGFTKAMKSLGHDAYEIVCDLEILQKTWAKEMGVMYDLRNWQTEIILKQIEHLKPVVIYFQDINFIPYSILKNIKNLFPFVKMVVVYKGYPGSFNVLDEVDLLFVGSPTMVEQFKEAGLRPHLLYHSFDESILEKSDVHNPDENRLKYDFTFIGSSGYGYDLGHHSRYWTLVYLIANINIETWIHDRFVRKKGTRDKIHRFFMKASRYSGFWALIKIIIRGLLMKVLKYFKEETLNKLIECDLFQKGVIGSRIKNLLIESTESEYQRHQRYQRCQRHQNKILPIKPLHEMFPGYCHPPVFGVDMYKVLRQSKVTFNKHTDAAGSSVANKRMFEATGIGTCLLTDTGKNMSDLFDEDREVVTYTSVDECIEKVEYLLEHDAVRRQIAEAGQRRTLKDHTMKNRCEQIDEIIQKML